MLRAKMADRFVGGLLFLFWLFAIVQQFLIVRTLAKASFTPSIPMFVPGMVMAILSLCVCEGRKWAFKWHAGLSTFALVFALLVTTAFQTGASAYGSILILIAGIIYCFSRNRMESKKPVDAPPVVAHFDIERSEVA